MKISNTAGSILVVSVVAAIGVLLALQGWKSQTLPYDYLVDIDNAHGLLHHHRIPDSGSLSSFAAFNPPGTAWLMAPGVLLFDDPRLFAFIGSATVFIGTLVGILLLARTCMGMPCAVLSVVLYGLSTLGLSVAGSLWQRYPIHLFYVWMVYWSVRWVRDRKPGYFAAAMVTWALGLYTFMEIAPALFILPAIWLTCRPPLKVGAILLAGTISAIVWLPYLRFEYARSFADLKSHARRQYILPINYKDAWCNAGLVILNQRSPATARHVNSGQYHNATGSLRASVSARLRIVWERTDALVRAPFHNFRKAVEIPGMAILLTCLVFSAIVALSVPRMPAAVSEIAIRLFWRNWLKWLAFGMILSGVLLNEFTIARYLSPDGSLEAQTIPSIRWWQASLVLVGILLLMLRRKGSAVVNRLAINRGAYDQEAHPARNAGVLLLSLIVPWVILLMLTEPNRTERFWWLWPLQVVFLAASVTHLPAQLKATRHFSWIGSVFIVLMVSANPLLLSRSRSWLSEGWSGKDPDEAVAVNFIADQIKAKGQDHAAIGYDLNINNYYATFNSLESRYKVGAPHDLLLRYRHGIENTDQCAEGVSPDDEYRIVQDTGMPGHEQRGRIHLPPDDRFRLLTRVGSYRVLKREVSPGTVTGQ